MPNQLSKTAEDAYFAREEFERKQKKLREERAQTEEQRRQELRNSISCVARSAAWK
ncbi:MAG: hypothetical protein M5R36_20535 [Deltaproteobacteria bacterium]|nr:hypothetical protein [Deltaproteobacteria bacterium]